MHTDQHIPGARKVTVGFWADEFEAVGEAWITEADWNGFEIPHFEREDLVKALGYLTTEDTVLRMDGDILTVELTEYPEDSFTIEPNPVYGTYDLGPLGCTFDTKDQLPALYDWDAAMRAEPDACPCCGLSREEKYESGLPRLYRSLVAPLGAEPMCTLNCPDCESVVWSMVAPTL